MKAFDKPVCENIAVVEYWGVYLIVQFFITYSQLKDMFIKSIF